MAETFPAEHLDLLKRHLAAENAHDLDGTLATLTADCVFDDLASGRRWLGHVGAGEHYRMWWDAFDNQVSTEVRHFPAPDVAIVVTRWAGRHVGQFWGIPPGRDIDVPVVIFVTIRDGLMASEQFSWDRATLLNQLGVTTLPEELQ
jgi:steroid delta-isomerase-like uncharacterized protein